MSKKLKILNDKKISYETIRNNKELTEFIKVKDDKRSQ